MFVIKRSGKPERVHYDKITKRIQNLCNEHKIDNIDCALVTQKVSAGVCSGITTSELDELASQTCAYMTSHPNYAVLAAAILVSNLQKNTNPIFSEVMHALRQCKRPKTGEPAPLVSEELIAIVDKHKERLNAAIVHSRDFLLDYFGARTLMRSYLLKINKQIVERIQYMYMRVAIGIHGDDIENIIKTYHYTSQHFFTHATPTMYNAGTLRPQMSSCVLMAVREDSIEGIYDTLKDCAVTSKNSAGIGIACHHIRAKGSYIAGTNGESSGLIPMIRNFNETARYVDQGGGKRKGAFAMYLEPWHADIFEFLALRRNHGDETDRARDLHYGLWVPDLFMRRVKEKGKWSLFCPKEAPGLHLVHSEKFEELYMKYEQTKGLARQVIDASKLWREILTSQIETGEPYMLYKDSCNRKSNHQHLGTLQLSNLCTEILEFVEPGKEIAVCNLASVSLPKCCITPDPKSKIPDLCYNKLYEVVYYAVGNLNKVVDRNYYPVAKEMRKSNLTHRPVGIGVQGLADLFALLRIPFDSQEALVVNRQVFECIYFAALRASCDLAKEYGKPYDSYEGSPMSKGLLQFDLWGQTERVEKESEWDWKSLRADIAKYGVWNSLLVAPMPTATTSQIMGNVESFEPFHTCYYVRKTSAGEFARFNKYFVQELIDRGLWTEGVRQQLVAHNGSIQKIAEIPEDMKPRYKTSFEMSTKTFVDLAVERAPFIDQSQSLNWYMGDPNERRLTRGHFDAWERGLKTGMYYLRTQGAVEMMSLIVDKQFMEDKDKKKPTTTTTTASTTEQCMYKPGMPKPLDCEACGS